MQGRIKKAFDDNHLTLSPMQIERLARYLGLIQSWNRVFNLTAITDPDDMIYLHLVDSLKIGPYLHGPRCLDIGSGAGLPGIPLAIYDPSNTWVLLDKNSKKTRFLTQVIAELALPNVAAIHQRVQDFAVPSGFDSILSRAFGTLKDFVLTSRHLLAPQGQWLAMKGKVPEVELTDLPADISKEIIPLPIQGRDIERHLIIMKRN